MRISLVSILLASTIISCGECDPAEESCEEGNALPDGELFEDTSKASGIWENGYVKQLTQSIPINDHSRLGFVDINGDGYDDIVAHSLYPNPQAGVPFTHLVQLNNGDGTFRDFSEASGLQEVQGAFFAFGDVDNDGDQDCFVGLDIPLGGQSDRLLINDGEGHFTERQGAGVESTAGSSTNALFADFDGDSNLDLFVGRGGTSSASADLLYMGNGDGTFRNESARLQQTISRPSNGSVTCDYDNDGDLDIFVSVYGVSHQNGHNVLWRNDGGVFTNVADEVGFSAHANGNYFLQDTQDGETIQAPATYVGSNGFGIDCKDINNDGNYDVLITAISHPVSQDYLRKWSDPTQLLINQGGDEGYRFVNAFLDRGLIFNEGDVDGALVDIDNDGRLDISISRDNKYETNYPDEENKAWFGIYVQGKDGSFASRGLTSGINTQEPVFSASHMECSESTECPQGEVCLKSRCRVACLAEDECTVDELCGSWFEEGQLIQFCRSNVLAKGAQNHAWSDIDLDGDMDLLIGGRDKGGGRPNFLFRNDVGSENAWIGFRIEGDGSDIARDAIGTRVTLTFDDGTMLSREVQSARGMYNSMDMRALHMGIAGVGCEFDAEIRWPNGQVHTLRDIKVGAYNVVTYPDQVSQ